jgi:hypothetical protein
VFAKQLCPTSKSPAITTYLKEIGVEDTSSLILKPDKEQLIFYKNHPLCDAPQKLELKI